MRGLVSQLVRDAVELTRVSCNVRARTPGAREVLREIVGNDGYAALAAFRVRALARRIHLPGANHALRLLTTAMFGIEIDSSVQLGDGVAFVHTLGTVIGGGSVVGNRVRFMGNNTVGSAKDDGWPVIDDDVLVGCGARVLGPIRVGKGAVIGANAVVLGDVAPGEVVGGIPARPLRASASARKVTA